jgi:adenosine deaminase
VGRIVRAAWLRRLLRIPKVEIHLHLEGTVSLRRARILWARRDRDPDLPPDPAVLYRHRSFPEFLRHFALITRALTRPEDFADVTRDLCRVLRRRRVAAAEVFFSPVIFVRRGLPFAEIFDAVWEAALGERRRGGPELRFLFDAVRQWGERGCEENLECTRLASGRVVGVGIGGDETSVPARVFAPVFAEARRLGLRTVAHAGEFAGASSVAEAVELLRAERIGHGIRAVEDPGVLRLLRRGRIPLEVCPTSNLRTGVVRRWSEHPLPGLLRAGLRVTLNSDDPALFCTGLPREYAAAALRLGVSRRGLVRIARAGILASFLPAARKRELLAPWRSGAGG